MPPATCWAPRRVKVTQDDYDTKITGILKCSFVEDQEDVRVVAILRNKASHVIGGEYTYVDKVRCDKGTPVSMTTLGRMSKAVKADILPTDRGEAPGSPSFSRLRTPRTC